MKNRLISLSLASVSLLGFGAGLSSTASASTPTAYAHYQVLPSAAACQSARSATMASLHSLQLKHVINGWSTHDCEKQGGSRYVVDSHYGRSTPVWSGDTRTTGIFF